MALSHDEEAFITFAMLCAIYYFFSTRVLPVVRDAVADSEQLLLARFVFILYSTLVVP